MQDRLAELRRQRALIAEHLAWLDREIAAGPGSIPTSPPAPPASSPTLTPPPLIDPAAILAKASEQKTESVPPAMVDPHADLLPEPQPADIKSDVRRGCFLYLALATVAVVVFGGLLVWAGRAYRTNNPQPARTEQPAERP